LFFFPGFCVAHERILLIGVAIDLLYPSPYIL
jgi:hypothetical protein